MTEEEKNMLLDDDLLLDDLKHIRNELCGYARDATISIETVTKTINESVDDIVNWRESIEARLTSLEKRVAMINAFYVAKEAVENERRKAREKPVHVCRRCAGRAVNRQDNGV